MDDLLAGCLDPLKNFVVKLLAIVISASGCKFHDGQSSNEIGVLRDRDARDPKILHGTSSLHAVISGIRNRFLAEKIVFNTHKVSTDQLPVRMISHLNSC